MRVVIDTSAIAEGDWYLEHNAAQALLGLSDRGEIELLLPEVVYRELGKKHAEAVSRELAKRDSPTRAKKLNALQPTDRRSAHPQDAPAEMAPSHSYGAALWRTVTSAGGRLLDLPETSPEVLLDRSLACRAPFDQRGRTGFRDALIWETIMELATRSEPVVFITKDSDFLDPVTRARLHPDLIEDLAAAGLPRDRIRPVESLKEAVEQVVRPARELRDSLRVRLSSDAAWSERLVARLKELATEDADAVGFEVDVVLDMGVERCVEEIDGDELDYLDHFSKVAIADALSLGADGFGVEIWLSATAFYDVSVILSNRVWDAPSDVRAAIDDGYGLSERSATVGGSAQVLLIFEATYDPESDELTNISLRRMSDDQGEPSPQQLRRPHRRVRGSQRRKRPRNVGWAELDHTGRP